jgi:hypothetical protein
MKKAKTKLKFNTPFHPQIDSQIERVNEILKQYLRNYVVVDHRYWGHELDLVEFCCNSTKHSMTWMSPFELVLGMEVNQPLDLTVFHKMGFHRDGGKNVQIMAKERKELNARAKKLFEEAQTRYEKHANKSRREIQFEVGDLVMLNIHNFKMFEAFTARFIPKYPGPYRVTHKPHLDVYMLLATTFVANPTFHESKLKSFKADDKRPEGKQEYHKRFNLMEH